MFLTADELAVEQSAHSVGSVTVMQPSGHLELSDAERWGPPVGGRKKVRKGVSERPLDVSATHLREEWRARFREVSALRLHPRYGSFDPRFVVERDSYVGRVKIERFGTVRREMLILIDFDDP
ncbi:hypothetical protein E3T28_07115 [Cryobacterium sinapicolor]|uniref:Uncharacterized protein n=1 Tax=Cryobacterium sinapicolor TaxID=1259236 RepID=A0ABY2J8N7_9MICO|nr:hypothetical protein [Cryobacterium sinapicolor]TFD01319.1 hypothetical protein E3T28_07115 [Cryobacterium sinapicolor]